MFFLALHIEDAAAVAWVVCIAVRKNIARRGYGVGVGFGFFCGVFFVFVFCGGGFIFVRNKNFFFEKNLCGIRSA
jgi:hypothetical protein